MRVYFVSSPMVTIQITGDPLNLVTVLQASKEVSYEGVRISIPILKPGQGIVNFVCQKFGSAVS